MPDPDDTGPLAAPVTSYVYDDAGNRVSRTDANGHQTTWAYDALNRPISETSPDPDGAGSEDASLTTTVYDANGNVLSATDANGNATPTSGDGVTGYTYDRADRLTGVDYSDATPDVTYGYDDVGNRTQMSDGAGTETRTYDGLDRLVSVARGSDTFVYAYDPAGNVTKRTYPDGSVVDYTFDPLGRMASVANAGRTVSYAYDAASNLLSTTLPSANKYVESRTYDRAGRLVEVKNAKPAVVQSDFVWTLDPVGNPLSETDSGVNPSTRSYSYDNLDRLTSVCFQTGGCPNGTDPFIRWAYDGVGNRLSEERPEGTTSYTYDAMDRLLSAGTTAFTFDADGRQLTAGDRTFTWDLAGRLLSTHVPGQTSSYSYGGDGNRLQSVDGGGAFNTTNYTWDVNGSLPSLVRESTGTGALHRRYVNGLTPLWWTTKTDDSSLDYFQRDPLDSVRAITSNGGGTIATYDYDPYGNLRSQTGSIANSIRFAGYYHDKETGLYYLHARQYDTTTGRLTSMDPANQTIGGAAISPYSYADNRPTVMVDPTGWWFDYLRGVAQAPAATAASPVYVPLEAGGGGGGGAWQAECHDKFEPIYGHCPEEINAGTVEVPFVRGGSLAIRIGVWGWRLIRGGRAAEDVVVTIGPKVAGQLEARGWTEKAIQQAMKEGKQVRAINKANGNPATRYISPRTGKSVVVDDVTREVIHVGGSGFRYGPRSGDVP